MHGETQAQGCILEAGDEEFGATIGLTMEWAELMGEDL